MFVCRSRRFFSLHSPSATALCMKSIRAFPHGYTTGKFSLISPAWSKKRQISNEINGYCLLVRCAYTNRTFKTLLLVNSCPISEAWLSLNVVYKTDDSWYRSRRCCVCTFKRRNSNVKYFERFSSSTTIKKYFTGFVPQIYNTTANYALYFPIKSFEIIYTCVHMYVFYFTLVSYFYGQIVFKKRSNRRIEHYFIFFFYLKTNLF